MTPALLNTALQGRSGAGFSSVICSQKVIDTTVSAERSALSTTKRMQSARRLWMPPLAEPHFSEHSVQGRMRQ